MMRCLMLRNTPLRITLTVENAAQQAKSVWTCATLALILRLPASMWLQYLGYIDPKKAKLCIP